eukprot:TRINITY_DN2300_c0_g1_i2.p1 TRINITY_DN2300_c0_g1~~TRINITY_DN2300_c0_g1_i2.p1  ORF type:complete len:873 (+),score=120.37 TRINITY_DN2300_c0_g1_i2:60-2678(+)
MSQDSESDKVNSNVDISKKPSKYQDEVSEDESKTSRNSQRIKLKLPEIISSDDRHVRFKGPGQIDKSPEPQIGAAHGRPTSSRKDSSRKSDKSRHSFLINFESPFKSVDDSSTISSNETSNVSFEETPSKKINDDESGFISSRSVDSLCEVSITPSNSSTPREKFASLRKKVFSSSKSGSSSTSPPLNSARESSSTKNKKSLYNNEYRVSGSLTQRPTTTNESSDDLSDEGEFTLQEFLAQEKKPVVKKKETNLRGSTGTPLKVKRTEINSDNDFIQYPKNDTLTSFSKLNANQSNLVFSFSSPCLPTELSEDEDESDDPDEVFDFLKKTRFQSSPEIPFVRKASLKRKLRSSKKSESRSTSETSIILSNSSSPRTPSNPISNSNPIADSANTSNVASKPALSPLNIIEPQRRRSSSPTTPITKKSTEKKKELSGDTSPSQFPTGSPPVSPQAYSPVSSQNPSPTTQASSPVTSTSLNNSTSTNAPPSNSPKNGTKRSASRKREKEEFKKWNSASDVLKTSDIKISKLPLSLQYLNPLIKRKLGYWIEVGNKDKERPTVYSLDGSQDDVTIPYYTKIFSQNVHHTYIGNDKSLGPYIVSILEKGEDVPFSQLSASHQSSHQSSESFVAYQVLICSKKGNDLQRYITKKSKKKPSMDTILKSIDPQLGRHNLKRIKDSSIVNKIVNFESIQIVNNFKFGILYCKEGQVHEREMFSNEHGSPEFKHFLFLLGKRIHLKGWPYYSGGLDTSDHCLTGNRALYTEWRDLSFIFHVSTMLPFYLDDPQQLARKRHLGNDIVLIIFKEGNTPYSPDTVASTFNHIIIVVQPVYIKDELKYRVSVASKETVPSFGPSLPEPALFNADSAFREFLLAKSK